MTLHPQGGQFENLPPVMSLDEFKAYAAEVLAPPPYESKFKAVRWSDLDAPGPEHEWLVKDVLTRGERSLMAGAMQSGKSFLAIDIALAIARGVPWLGNRTVRGGVVYQAGEGGAGIKRRLRAYRVEKGLKPEDRIPFVLLPAALDLHSGDQFVNQFISEVNHWAGTFDVPLELVVIDTLAASTPGADENSGKDMGPILARCDKISRDCKCAVMLVHHLNQSGSKARGHTSITANLDSVITVIPTEVMDIDRRIVREVKTTKQKDGEAGRTWRFVLPAVELGENKFGEKVTSCVVRPPNEDGEPGETAKPTDAGIRLTPQCEVFLRALYRALSEHGEDAPFALNLPNGTKVVKWKLLGEVFASMAFDGADEADPKKRQDKLSQAMKRHGEKLMQLRIIMRETPFVWLTGRKVRGFAKRDDTAGGDRQRGYQPPPPLESIEDERAPY